MQKHSARDSFEEDPEIENSLEDFDEAQIQGFSPVKSAKSKTHIDIKQNRKQLTEKQLVAKAVRAYTREDKKKVDAGDLVSIL